MLLTVFCLLVFLPQHSAALRRRDELTDARRAAWRDQNDLTRALTEKRDQLRKAEGALNSTLSRSTSAGLAVLGRLVQQHNIAGVYGPLIDLIACDSRYDKSVETVAGNKLFQVVVDTDETVDRLLALMKKERAGRLTFMPLNRLVNEDISYPANSDQAIPLILQLRFDERHRAAVTQVFGRTLLARNLQVGAELSRAHGFDCITLDGDQVNKRGAFTGGFIDARRSRMEAHKAIRALTGELAASSHKAEEAKGIVERADQEIATLLGDIQKLDAAQAKLRDQLKAVSLDVETVRRKKAVAAETAVKLAEQGVRTQRKAQELEERAKALRDELGSPMVQNLSAAEVQELEQCTAQESDIQRRLAVATRARSTCESEIKKLENLLATNLRRRAGEIKARLAAAADDEADAGVDTERHELTAAARELAEAESKLRDIEREIETTTAAARAIEADREAKKAAEARGLAGLQTDMQEIEKVMSRQSLLQQQRDECQRKIRELGSLPTEAHQEEYRALSGKDLTARLARNLKKMDKFKHVNRKAIDQFMLFNDKRAELLKKKEELDKGKKAIEELISSLDLKKDEAILRTFKGISKNFATVFQELVPGGKGSLRMQKKAKKLDGAADEAAADEDADVEEDEEDENAMPVAAAAAAAKGPMQYHGVEIKVSFTGSDQAFEMQQLSGGQKTVVALALIFAIQRCDPSPFYVFDEIDAALDPLYRTAVATMLAEQCATTQFVVTTFRPELLEAADRYLLVRFEAKISIVNEAEKAQVQRVLRAVEEEYERERAAASSTLSTGSVSGSSTGRR